MKKLILASIALSLAGCTALLPQPAKDKIVSGVKKYCVGMTYQERILVRSDINSMLDGVAEVKVHCQGDTE